MSDITQLDVFPEGYGYGVAWEDEGCPGLFLGEKAKDKEHEAATTAAKHIKGFRKDKVGRLLWDYESDALKALRAARSAVKAIRKNQPWPDWAIGAKAEGWSPPKGWTPSSEG